MIKVVNAGICDTDLAIYTYSLKVPTPLVIGHKFSGAAAKGPDRWIEKRVVPEINTPCERCYFCRIEKRYHSTNWKTLGMTTDGYFAE